MNLTAMYFDKIQKEIEELECELNNCDANVEQVKRDLDFAYNQLSDVFKQLYYTKNFNLTGFKAAEMLDVTEAYLFLKLKDKFDFIKPPRAAFTWMEDEITSLKESLDDIYEEAGRNQGVYTAEQEEKAAELSHQIADLAAMKLKKVFIDRESFENFLLNHTTIASDQMRIRISESDLDRPASKSVITQVVCEVLNATPTIPPGENEALNTAIKTVMSGRKRMYAGATIKQEIIRNSDVRNKKIYDTQLYRFLEGKSHYTKLIVSSEVNGQKQTFTRYILSLSRQAKAFYSEPDPDVYIVPHDKYHRNLKREIIKKINKKTEV